MAFGNPLISTNPVTDIYSSQANVYGNSFANPMNSANMNSGWGIDPSLLSPSYQAPYRPQYAGKSASNEYGRIGFFGGIGKLSPTADDIMWGNPFAHQQQSIEDVTSRPADAAAWGAHRIALPVASFMAGRAISRSLGLGWQAGSRFGANFGGGMASSFGARTASGMGVRGVWGATQSGGIRAGMAAMGGFGGAANLASRGIMGAGFGAAAWAGVPLAIGAGLIEGGERALINPYMNNRMSARSLRENFSGVTFGDAQGNAVTGGGLGFGESYKMASGITGQGISDMSFSTGEYRQGADMIGRAGLMDNINAGGINKRIKESMDQVKLIMSIASMPEMKDAIEQLAKLQQSGATVSGGMHSTAAQTMGTLGRLASQAGTSVQRMMNTVGAQGQYLYQANGMTPYLGQLAAGGAYSAFSAGNRMGLISSSQLARMGGIDGATQASLTGQVNASQTMFNQMALHNSFLGGGTGSAAYGGNQSSLDVIAKYANNMASDPLGVYGNTMLNGRQMAGKQMEERGSLAVDDQVGAIARQMPWLLDKNGQLNAGKAVPFMMQLGMDKDQIDAYFQQRISETDPGSYDLRMRAIQKNNLEQTTEYISQQGIYGGPIGSSIYNTRKFGRKVTRGVADNVINPITDTIGSAGDALQTFTHDMWFGNTLGDKSASLNEWLGQSAPVANTDNLQVFAEHTTDSRVLDMMNRKSAMKNGRENENVAQQLSALARSGDANAVAYFNAQTPGDKQKALRAALKSGKVGETDRERAENKKLYSDPASLSELDGYLNAQKRVSASAPEKSPLRQTWELLTGQTNQEAIAAAGKGKDKSGALVADLEKVSGIKGNKVDSLEAIGLSMAVFHKMRADENYAYDVDANMETDADLKRLSKLTGKTGAELLAHAQSMAISGSGYEGAGHLAANRDKSKDGTENETFTDIFNKNGGIKKGGLKNAKNLELDEVAGFQAIEINNAKEMQRVTMLAKEGMISTAGLQETKNRIEMGRKIDEFGKHVQDFGKIINKPGFIGETTNAISKAGLMDTFTSFLTPGGRQKLVDANKGK